MAVLALSLFNSITPAFGSRPGTAHQHLVRATFARPAEVAHGTSPPLRSLPRLRTMIGAGNTQPGRASETVRAHGIPAPSLNFDGIACDCTGLSQGVGSGVPADPNGAVGPNDFVEMVNSGVAVYDKSGGLLYGPVASNLLWSGFTGSDPGNDCSTDIDGDGVVVYDRMANRFVISQLSIPNSYTPGGPSFECVAVSATSDPTGAYYLYEFQYDVAINDYPKMGVWTDAYYETFNAFDETVDGAATVCAYDRAKMLAGLPATQQCFDLGPSATNLLPASVDSPNPPPPAETEYLLALGLNASGYLANSLSVWRFRVDWNNPSATAVTGPNSLAVAGYSGACQPSGSPCVPQPAPGDNLDALGDRLMFRLAYWNYGDHQSLVAAHTIVTGNTAGIRWYELRIGQSGDPSIYQQGTFSPADGNWRWIPSIAMDISGDLAAGYSVSGPNRKPSIGYTGRLASDTAGTMSQGENVAYTGGGVEPSGFGGRWGDYSDMTVDPTDDCTFWYVNQYDASNDGYSWGTRIISFRFPSCSQVSVRVNASGPYGSVPNLTGLSPSDSAIAFNPPAAASLMSGSLTCSTSATSLSPPASTAYPIASCSGLSSTTGAGIDYDYVHSGYTVLRAPLAVTASSASTTFGHRLPAITWNGAGFVSGDGPQSLSTAPTCSAQVTQAGGKDSSPAGLYLTTCSGGSAARYSLSYISGTLTVDLASVRLSYRGLATAPHGGSAVLGAKLVRSDSAAIADRKLVLTLGSQSCSGVTRGTGVMGCTIHTLKAAKGTRTVVMRFAGDPLGAHYDYAAGSARHVITVR